MSVAIGKIETGPHGLAQIAFYDPPRRLFEPPCKCSLFARVTRYCDLLTPKGYDAIISIHCNEQPVADAYLQHMGQVNDAAWWLATLVATINNMSMDDFLIKKGY